MSPLPSLSLKNGNSSFIFAGRGGGVWGGVIFVLWSSYIYICRRFKIERVMRYYDDDEIEETIRKIERNAVSSVLLKKYFSICSRPPSRSKLNL